MKNLIAIFLLSLSIVSCGGSGGGGSSTDDSQGGGGAVTAPTGLSLVWAVDFVSSINVTISGVTAGQTITLYSDSNCSTTVNSGIASTTSISLVANSLATGTHNFYAKAALNADESTCSTATVSYTVANCPSGFVQVPGNTTRLVAPFCVMKFEAKNVSGAAASNAASVPWTGVSANDAKAACTALNTSGSKYNLISNQEWMTIADNIQALVANFNQSGNASGPVFFTRGNTANYTSSPVNVSNEADYWNQSFASQSWEYRRIHYLTNNEIIWDLSGNAREIVDWGTDASTFALSPTCGGAVDLNYLELNAGATNCPSIAPTHYAPANSSWDAATHNIGRMKKFTASSVLVRSGQWNETNNAGIYAFLKTTITSASTALTDTGFRCVYRP